MSKNEHSDRVRSLFTIIQGKDVVLRDELIAVVYLSSRTI